MKKVILSIAAMAWSVLASAQMIAGYSAESSEGTYLELDNPTVVTTGVAAKDVVASSYLQNGARANGYGKSVTGEGFDIGFSFPFNGEEFTHFGVYSSGGIHLGKQSEMSMSSYSASSNWLTATGDDFDNSIFFHDAKARSYSAEEGDTLQIQYQTIGEAGNRQLILEFKNCAINVATSSSGTNLIGTYCMQLRLSEDGGIAIALKGLSEIGDQKAGEMTLGVRGQKDYTAWGVSLEELQRKFNSTFYSSTAIKLTNVADGFTVNITAPGDVVTPTTQPTGISYEMNTSAMNGVQLSTTLTPAEGADRTLLVLYEGTPDAQPVDGVTYNPYTYNAEGDKIGNGQVWLASDATSVNINKLKHSTSYTLVAYAFNSYGTNGPKYNTVDPATAAVITSPEQPKSVSLVSKTQNSLTINVEANEAGDKVFVAYSDKTYEDTYGARGYIGEPSSALVAGDNLYIGENEAGKVAYFGNAGELTIENLDASTSYYLTVYSYNEASDMFSCGEDTLHLHTSTIIVPTYELDLASAPWGDVPGGWKVNKNKGFQVPRPGTGDTKGQNGGRCFNATRDKNMALTLMSPEIMLPEDSELSFDFHMHAKTSGYMGSTVVYDEWEDEDELLFLLYVEGEEEPVVLKKYDVDHPAEFETVSSWNTFTADLTPYAGKMVNVCWSFKCVATTNVYFGMENFKVKSNVATSINNVNTNVNSNVIYNLQGQRVNECTKGIFITNGKKVLVK